MTSAKIRTIHLGEKKERGEKIVMITAYDFSGARLADAAGVDVILVGDSLANVVLGHDTTIPVTLEQMIHHCAAVKRGTQRALVAADMPFMSYKISAEQALAGAMRLMQEGGAEAVKLEGGEEIAPIVQRLVAAGLPVMGHIGLLPQSIHRLGGYRVQGKNSDEADRLFSDARALVDAGVFAIVLELMMAAIAQHITQAVRVPTIGIGAGPHCDGQVLVFHDLLGLNATPKRFVKPYANLDAVITDAIRQYAADVRESRFPTREHSFPAPDKNDVTEV
jgi:3-methyl-2-oxobutanoate hydroxymethyltransferase